jgi:hypothetical protein
VVIVLAKDRKSEGLSLDISIHRSRISPVDGDARRALANGYIRTAVTGRKLATAISVITTKVANVAP